VTGQEGERQQRRSNRRLAAFALGVASVIAATVYLVSVLTGASEPSTTAPDAGDGSTTPDSTATVAATATPTDEVLRVFGPLPSSPVVDAMQPADADGADLVFSISDEPDAIPARWWVAVADPAAGVYGLTLDQAQGLASGEISNWSEVGGRDLPVQFAVAGPAADQARQRELMGLPANVGGTHYDSYDDLLAGMLRQPGSFAVMPLRELRPVVTALAIDGIDIVRGEGDPATYPLLERLDVDARTKRGERFLETQRDSLAVATPQPIRVKPKISK
jgi:hypothetical protein